MILLDTSGLLAASDRRDRSHSDVIRVLSRPQMRVLSPFVLAELDYLLTQLGGQNTAMALLEEVVRGAYELAPFSGEDVDAARAIITRYHDLNLGLADASVIVLAQRHRCSDILTLDYRHFRAVRTASGQPFRLLPADDL